MVVFSPVQALGTTSHHAAPRVTILRDFFHAAPRVRVLQCVQKKPNLSKITAHLNTYLQLSNPKKLLYTTIFQLTPNFAYFMNNQHVYKFLTCCSKSLNPAAPRVQTMLLQEFPDFQWFAAPRVPIFLQFSVHKTLCFWLSYKGCIENRRESVTFNNLPQK